MNSRKLQKQYFATLQEKYQVTQQSEPSSFLYFILRKAELNLQITASEFQWLTEHHLADTATQIAVQQYQSKELQRLESQLQHLRQYYQIPEAFQLAIADPIASILWKVEAGDSLLDSELNLLGQQGLTETSTFIQEVLRFSQLKVTYKATQHTHRSPEDPLYSILKKLELRETLSDTEADWLLAVDLYDTLELYWQQEAEKKAECEFLALKLKYQVTDHPDPAIASPLYAILQKLETETELYNRECKWLRQQNLHALIAIDQQHKEKKYFAALKQKYQATQFQECNPESRLFLILKTLDYLDATPLISQESSQSIAAEIQWLSQQSLTETTQFLKSAHFKALKAKYQILGTLEIEPFYEIMLKLEREERLDSKQVIQLIEAGQLSRTGKIAIAYYRLEAIFYETEYQRTGNRWNLASASRNWRKADKPTNALQATETVNWNNVKEMDLKAALLVTRGAAFRDLEQLTEAEHCATQAIECQPTSHQPYTLMGAICYDQRNYLQGDRWFELATERGATDTDDEIKRIVRMTKQKDKRRDVVEYLLNKDPKRYQWAKAYLKEKSS